MWDLFRKFYAILAAMPPIGYLFTYGLIYIVTKNRLLARLRALDVTTLFLLSAVSVLWYNVTGGSGWILVLSLFLLLGISLAFAQWWIRGQFHFRKWLRGVWRIGFLLLSALYVFLFVIGIFLLL